MESRLREGCYFFQKYFIYHTVTQCNLNNVRVRTCIIYSWCVDCRTIMCSPIIITRYLDEDLGSNIRNLNPNSSDCFAILTFMNPRTRLLTQSSGSSVAFRSSFLGSKCSWSDLLRKSSLLRGNTSCSRRYYILILHNIVGYAKHILLV